MSRIKGKWVGLIEIEFDAKREENMLSLAEIQANAREHLAGDVEEFINDEIVSGAGTAKVTMQLCDIYEVKQEPEE